MYYIVKSNNVIFFKQNLFLETLPVSVSILMACVSQNNVDLK